METNFNDEKMSILLCEDDENLGMLLRRISAAYPIHTLIARRGSE